MKALKETLFIALYVSSRMVEFVPLLEMQKFSLNSKSYFCASTMGIRQMKQTFVIQKLKPLSQMACISLFCKGCKDFLRSLKISCM